MDTIKVVEVILQGATDVGRTGSKLTPAEMTKPNTLKDFNGKWNCCVFKRRSGYEAGSREVVGSQGTNNGFIGKIIMNDIMTLYIICSVLNYIQFKSISLFIFHFVPIFLIVE